MYIPDTHPHVAIETVPADLDDAKLERVAQEIGDFAWHTIQKGYYIDTLGLTRIDPDPIPGSPKEMPGRIARLREAPEMGIAYMVARYRDERAADARTALAGLLISQSVPSPHKGTPQGLEIVEWNVAENERGTEERRGLGGVMLRHLMKDISDSTPVRLCVAETNPAIALYRHLGFVRSGEPQEQGVFNVQHIPMATDAGTMKRQLGM